MINIIKQGVKPKKFKTIFKVTCENCDCIFEFDQDEISGEKHLGGRRYVVCPCCNNLISLRDIPNLETREEEVIE